MKKKLFFQLPIFMIIFAFNCSSYAQVTVYAPALNQSAVIEKIPASDFDGHLFSLASPSGINIKAMRDFIQSYKGAENVHWYRASDGVIAYFTEDGIKNMAGYDTKGNWLSTMRSYEESSLPKEIRMQVKSVYYDYAITWVNEITKGHQIMYMVHLEDKTRCKIIRVCENEEMETTEDFLK